MALLFSRVSSMDIHWNHLKAHNTGCYPVTESSTIVAYSSACTLLFLSNSPTIIYVYLFIVELSFQFRVSFLATLLLQRGKWISTHLCQDCKWLTACQCIVKQYLTTCKECFVKFYIQYIHKLFFKIIYPLIIHQITEV